MVNDEWLIVNGLAHHNSCRRFSKTVTCDKGLSFERLYKKN